MKLFKRLKTNNKGLSLVELICAVAILSIVFIAVGSAMVVSAQSYSKGTYELDVQQEAQTTTNLVGNLLVDAVEATFDKVTDPANPVLVIKGEGVTYKVTHDTANATLNYEEVDSAGNVSTGVLAENVTTFDTNLTEDSATFEQDRNVEVSMEVEKNNRTYEATYDTTARNGSANMVGATDTLTILVDTEIVLEPNQTYLLPVSVVGSATNKAIKVGKANAADPITVSAVNGSNPYISVTVGNDAAGAFAFVISTMEDDGNTPPLPLDSKTVTVKVRRVTGLVGSATPTGTNYLAGTSYKVAFTVSGDNMDKVFGKDFDTDYVNPRNVSYTYDMTGMEDGYNVNDYIGNVSFVYTDAPYMYFKLLRDMPMGAEITVTATTLHTQTANKTGISYVTAFTYPVKIKRPNNWVYPGSELRRGSDGVEILTTGEYMTYLINTYGNNFRKYYTVYEVTYNEFDVETSRTFCFDNVELVDSGSVTNIRPEESKRLQPDKDYVLEMYLKFYDESGNVVFPLPDTPKEDYCCEYPLDAASVTYDYQINDGEGYESSPYTMTKGDMDTSIYMNIYGLEMTKYPRDHFKFKVEVFNGSEFVPYTGSPELDIQTVYSAGYVQLKCKFGETGRYRILPYLQNIPYKTYDGVDTSGSFNLYDDVDFGEGVFYINVN